MRMIIIFIAAKNKTLSLNQPRQKNTCIRNHLQANLKDCDSKACIMHSFGENMTFQAGLPLPLLTGL